MDETRPVRVAFIGAGGVNFGGAEGPWDHASRLERIGGVTVVGAADLEVARAQRVLAERLAGPAAGMYAQAKAFADLGQMLAEARPHAVFVGLPPECHGLTSPPGDDELACAAAGVHIFLEKPLGSMPPERLAPVADALDEAAGQGLIVSVGYMLRYGRAIDKMRQLIAEAPLGVRAVIARYNCAYSEIPKPAWWDTRLSGGPIIEQATHFCDLARYLAGDVDLSSVRGVEIPATSPLGELVEMPAGPDGGPMEGPVPAAHRMARATAAVWRFESGAIGSLTHGVLLHRKKYAAELEVWGDGLAMVLADPYGDCRLHVRHPHTEKIETFDFAEDDTYLAEDQAFIQAVRTDDASLIRSPYADAVKTYELTWAIRRAAQA